MKSKTGLLISVLIMIVIVGLVVVVKGADLFQGLDLVIIILIIIIAVIGFSQAWKRDKEKQQGFSVDDELSTLLKYKSGYYAYLVSMYMWLFIFLLKDHFPDIETMLGGGIVLSGIIAVAIKYLVKWKFNQH